MSLLYYASVTEREIETVIMNLKNNKAPGIDEIEARTLKEIAIFIKKPLCFLPNKMFEQIPKISKNRCS